MYENHTLIAIWSSLDKDKDKKRLDTLGQVFSQGELHIFMNITQV